MNQFREVRQMIRSMNPLQYWGVAKSSSIVNNTACRRFFIIQGPMPYRTVKEKYYRISNWRKRLAILEGMRDILIRKHAGVWPFVTKSNCFNRI